MNEDDFELEIKNEFLLEAAEMLEETESSFLELENNPNDDDVINRIFRLAHTVKGSAYAAGFNGLAEFAHVFETLLGKIRNSEIDASSDVVDVLLVGNDILCQYVDALKEDFNGSIDTQDVSNKIKQAMGMPTTEGQSSPSSSNGEGNSSATETGSTGTTEVLPGLHLFDGEDEEPASSVTSTEVVPGLHLFEDEPTPAESKAPEANTNSSSQFAEGEILVVDDEPSILEIVEDSLEELGLKVKTFEKSLEALAYLKKGQTKIDLVISDIKMPEMGGIEFIRAAKAVDDTIPVIFFSGVADRKELSQCLTVGAADFIEKPVEEDLFKNSVSNALKLKRYNDTIMLLSSLNFRAYVSSVKISKFGPSVSDVERANANKALEAILDQIAELTNSLMSGFQQKKVA